MRYMAIILLLPLAMLARAEAELPPADSVLVDKSARKLWLLSAGRKYREYNISLGKSPRGHKQRLGDKKTPEGSYVIDYRNPESRYHLSLHIDYPREHDRLQALEQGVNPGGNIFIHGLPNSMGKSHTPVAGDWTDGCIAVTNRAIEEIWELVADGTPIEILQ